MPESAEIAIQRMKKEDRRGVLAAMRRSFPLTQQWMLSLSPHVLVGKGREKVLGAVVLKVFTISPGRKGGLIAWIFTVPEVRGLGLGQRLAEAGISYLEEQGCQEIFASVEGYNYSSSKIFASRGFGIISPGRQFLRYKLRTPLVWFKTFHYLDVGHFLWVRPAPQEPDSPGRQWWGTVAMNSLLWLLMIWRNGGFASVNLRAWFGLSLATLILYGLRYLGMRAAAGLLGLRSRFRAWESGFPLSALIALVLGGNYPIPGNLYPREKDLSYRSVLPKMGPVALTGALPILAVALIIKVTGEAAPGSGMLYNIAWLANTMVFFDILLPFFPFTSYNGRRIWDWNKCVWSAMALASIYVLFL